MPSDKMWTVKEIADEYRVTRQYIYNLIKEGKLKAITFGKVVRIHQDDLNEFLEASNNG